MNDSFFLLGIWCDVRWTQTRFFYDGWRMTSGPMENNWDMQWQWPTWNEKDEKVKDLLGITTYQLGGWQNKYNIDSGVESNQDNKSTRELKKHQYKITSNQGWKIFKDNDIDSGVEKIRTWCWQLGVGKCKEHDIDSVVKNKDNIDLGIENYDKISTQGLRK